MTFQLSTFSSDCGVKHLLHQQHYPCPRPLTSAYWEVDTGSLSVHTQKSSTESTQYTVQDSNCTVQCHYDSVHWKLYTGKSCYFSISVFQHFLILAFQNFSIIAFQHFGIRVSRQVHTVPDHCRHVCSCLFCEILSEWVTEWRVAPRQGKGKGNGHGKNIP